MKLSFFFFFFFEIFIKLSLVSQSVKERKIQERKLFLYLNFNIKKTRDKIGYKLYI